MRNLANMTAKRAALKRAVLMMMPMMQSANKVILINTLSVCSVMHDPFQHDDLCVFELTRGVYMYDGMYTVWTCVSTLNQFSKFTN